MTKRALPLLLLATGLARAGYVQSNACYGGTTTTCTLAATPAAGNVIVVFAAALAQGTWTSATDNQTPANTYTQLVTNTTSLAGVAYAARVATATGAFTVTLNSTNPTVHMIVAEYSAVTATPDGASAGYLGGPFSAYDQFVPCGSVTTTNAADLLVTAVIEGGYGGDNVAIVENGSFATRYPPSGYGYTNIGLADEAVSASGVYAPTWHVWPGYNMSNGDVCLSVALQQFAAASMTAAPAAIPANHSGNITLTLTGTNTSWSTGSTVFTVSGVSGASKVSQSVGSATSATVVVHTGAGTGTLTITESGTGTAIATTTIGTATLSVTPTSGLSGQAATVTLTGTNTVWTQENAGALFTLSGIAGSSFAGTPTVTTNTLATATINLGSSLGTLTITDSTTGASANFSGTGPACTGYAYSVPLTVAQVTGALVNFPVMVSLTAPPQNILSPQGNDICISDASNSTSLPIQWLASVNAANLSVYGYSADGPVHEYNWATGKVNFVFQAPALSATGATTFKIWTGNPFATNPDTTAVWDSSATLVAHLQEPVTGSGPTGGTINAVSGGFNGPSNAATRVAGQIGFAQTSVGTINFNGTGTNCYPGCNGETVEVLVMVADGATPTTDLANGGRFQGSGTVPDLEIVGGRASCYATNNVQGPFINDGNWHFLSCASGPANNGFYVDGALIGNPGENDGYNGTLDLYGENGVTAEEFRVSSTARSAAWIAAEAANLLHPASFVTIGTWTFSAATGPAITGASLAGNSPNSLKATWTTSTAATSQVLCGTTSGGPYTYFTPMMQPVQSGTTFWGVTNHAAAITGLPNNTSNTAYYCVVRSIDASGNWTTSSEMHAGTLAAAVSTPFQVSYVSPPTRPNDQPDGQNGMATASCWFDGDTQYSTWAADGNQYGMCEDCSGPQNQYGSNSPALMVYKWTSPLHLCASEIAYGGSTAGGYPGGTSWDSIGMISVNGSMYWAVGRREGPFCCNSVLKSADYWAHSLAPQHNSGPAATPVAGIDWPTPGNAMFQRGTMLTAWVQYGQDYNSSGTLPWYAGTDGWVMAVVTDNYGPALTRTRIEDMPLQDPGKRQYYIGTQTGDDGLYDTAWSYDYTQAVNLENNDPQLTGSFSKFSMTFVPDFNRFALVLNPQNPVSSFTAGTEVQDCAYPWSICMSVGTAPRNTAAFIGHDPGFGQLLSASYTKLSAAPLEASMALSTASGYTYATTPAGDNYSTLMYNNLLLGARADRRRPEASSNGRTAHIAAGLELEYEFGGNGTGNTGDTVMVNQAPSDPTGVYNTAVNVAADQFNAFYFDQYGMYNFGFSGSNGRTGLWGAPQFYTLTTPYAKPLGAFTAVVVWGHYPASVTANGTTYTLTVPANETVAAKGTDLVIQRNGTTASSWNVTVSGTAVANGVACADGSFCALVVRRDGSNRVTVYRSNSIGGSLPLMPDASAMASGAWSGSALTFGSSLVGEMAEGLVWSRALSDAELIQEMGVVRRNMAARGVAIQ